MTESKSDSNIFKGLESWQPILEKCGAVEVYNKVKDLPNLAPPKELIFECFRYFKPCDMKILILGQDPYPGAGDACGLCFATSTGNCPASLKPIYTNLINNNICPANIKKNGNLKPWAAQGVLLLNTALTTVVGKSKVHTSLWADFTAALMKQINEFEQGIEVFQWGNDAKAFSKYFSNGKEPRDVRSGDLTNRRHTLRKWTHPSPMADNSLPEDRKFKNCDHFKACMSIIDWNPEQEIMVWTDGACSGNGTDKAIASFGCLIVGGYMKRTTVSGKVQGYKYIMKDNSLTIDEKSPEIPTNNRGELLGIAYALWALDQSYITGNIEMIIDSEYALKTLEDYYPKRLAKGTEKELLNLDLLEICYKLIHKIRQHSALIFVHTRSHQSLPVDADDRSKCIHAGNEIVDALAVKSKDNDNFEVAIDSKLPALLKHKK